MGDPSVIELEDLYHNYGERTALCGISFTVGQGEIFGLLGPNGGGKTTLFRILSTLICPTEGRVHIFGLDIFENPDAIRRRIGVVFQNPSLDRKLTVTENLRHQGHLYGLYGSYLKSRTEEVLTVVGLPDRAEELVENLSGGLRRRVELAKGLLHKPGLLIFDEPSTGLDPGARRNFWKNLEELRDRHSVTVLLTTHFVEEAERCDRIGIIDQGKLAAVDSPDSLKRLIGGDVIVLKTQDPKDLKEDISRRFGVESTILNSAIRIECQDGHQFVAQLFDTFKEKIQSVTFGKPTLEDVFIQKTGHRFEVDGEVTALP